MERGHFPTQEYLPSRRKDNTQRQSIHNPPIAVHNMAIPELTWQGFFLHSSSLWFDLLPHFHPVSNWRDSFFPTQLKLLVPAHIYFAGLCLLDLYFYTGVQINWSHLSNKGHPTQMALAQEHIIGLNWPNRTARVRDIFQEADRNP